MKKQRLGIFAACVCAGGLLGTPAAHAAPGVGDRAEELGIETLLRGPDGAGTTWADLEGKVVLVEFWATWCGPCIAAFPHLNEIVHDVADRDDIVMIAVTDESRETVEKFLKKKELDAWVGLDTDRSSFDAYGVVGIPHTVIVDKEGTIAAVTYPTMVKTEHLLRVADGKPINLPNMAQRLGGGDAAAPVDGGAAEMVGGMDMNPESIRKMSMSMTKPGEAQERIGFLAGHWDVEETMLMGPPGAGGAPIGGTMHWRWNGEGRHLVGTATVGENPKVETTRIMGWDSEDQSYFLHEFDPLSVKPVVWSGVWDKGGASLTFTREEKIKIMGAPGGDAEGMSVEFSFVIKPSGDDGFEAKKSIVFPENGPKMPGMPSEQEILSISGVRSGQH